MSDGLGEALKLGSQNILTITETLADLITMVEKLRQEQVELKNAVDELKAQCTTVTEEVE